jgi:hypothetical protein
MEEVDVVSICGFVLVPGLADVCFPSSCGFDV